MKPARHINHSIRIALAAATLLLLTACQASQDDGSQSAVSGSPGAPAETIAKNVTPGAHSWTTPDGNEIPYVVAGNADADVTVVLVHCWMCDRTFWNEQLAPLGAAYRTIVLDLPGHGEATDRRDGWTVEAYGEDVIGLVRNLDLEDVVLIGHSMGGPVALRAAADLEGSVRGIVAVDTLHDADFRFEGPQIDGLLSAFETNFEGTCAQFIDQMFPGDETTEKETYVLDRACDPNRATIATQLMRSFGAIDMPAWMRNAQVPIRAINAAGPNPTNLEGNRAYADFDVAFVEDAGHFLHMTHPDVVNPLLLTAIEEVLADTAIDSGADVSPGA